MNTFKEFLSGHLNLHDEQLDELITKCSHREVGKDDFLLRQGEYSRYVYFVEKGLLKQYSIDKKGKEHILMFAPENWLVADRESIYFHQPSLYFIRALEDSVVTLLEVDFILGLSEKDKTFLELNNRLLNNHIRHLQNRINSLLSDSAEERYLSFVNTYPDILLRVPQIMVASYLGVTPETLSRVRRDMAERNFKK